MLWRKWRIPEGRRAAYLNVRELPNQKNMTFADQQNDFSLKILIFQG